MSFVLKFGETNSINGFIESLEEIEKYFSNQVSKTKNTVQDTDVTRRIERADWYLRGLAYHANNITGLYGQFASGVSARSKNIYPGPPSVIIMYAKETQALLFEFYALVNLSKIALDSLSKLLYPLFENRHLPKSITAFQPGTTNCPVYETLCKIPEISYLVDLRNCLVHYRSLASTDNAFVMQEGILLEADSPFVDPWTDSMFQATYRLDGEKVVVNVLFPDEIFLKEDKSTKKLSNFTYKNKFNLLSFSYRFATGIIMAYCKALELLRDPTIRYKYK